MKMNLKRKSSFLGLFTCKFRCQFQLHFRPDLLYRHVNNMFLPEQDKILCKMYFLTLINIYDQCKSEMTCINKIERAFVSRLTNQRRSVSWILKVYTHTNWGNLGNFLAKFYKGHFNKWKNVKYKVKLRFYKCLLPVTENLQNFSSTHVRLWYFVRFWTLLFIFSRKISHFSLFCHTISLRNLLEWAVENLVIFTTWEAFPSHLLHRGTVVWL